MAKTITLSLPHKLGREEAKRRIMNGVAANKQKFANMAKVEDSWAGDRMEFRASAMGQSVTGRVDVADDNVTVHLDLPMFLAMMSGRIKGEIESEGRKLLEQK